MSDHAINQNAVNGVQTPALQSVAKLGMSAEQHPSVQGITVVAARAATDKQSKRKAVVTTDSPKLKGYSK
jgi:hypothetical protein